MTYSRPNAFVSIVLAEPAAPVLTPSFYPTMIAPHFQVEYQKDVDALEYDSRAIEDIAYPGLRKQKVDTNSYLSVDVGDLTAGANDATGSPNTERFDPDVFIIEKNTQSRVDVSLAEALFVKSTGFTLPANMRWNPVTGEYKDTKGDIADGNMASAGTASWTPVSSNNDPVLAKDDTAGIPYGSNDYALKVTLHGTPDIGDGVESDALSVSGGETWTLKAFVKMGAGLTNYTVQVIDAVSKAVLGTAVAGKTNTGYEVLPVSITVTVPAATGSIAMRVISGAADAGGIFYVGDVTFYYADSNTDKLSGSIQVSYRALDEAYVGERLQRLEVASLDDLIALFGTHGLGPANPLGYMMYNAWVHSGLVTRGVAVGNPASDDGSSTYSGKLDDEILSYTASLDFINSNPDAYYGLAIGTWNEAVWDVFKASVSNLNATNRHWQRLIVNGEIPLKSTFRRGAAGQLMGMISDVQNYGAGALVDGDILTYNGVAYTIRVAGSQPYVALPFATNQDDLAVDINGDTDVTIDFTIEDAVSVTQLLTEVDQNFVASGFKKVKINDTAVIGTESFKVLAVQATAIVLEHLSGAEVSAGVNKSYSIYRYITLDGTSTGRVDKATLASTAATRAEGYASERMVITLPEWYSADINNVETDVEGWYLAAQLAAELCYPSAPAAQRGPGFPVGQAGFTSLREAKTNDFKSSRYFTEAQLDIIAGGGNAIIENDEPGTVLTCRHPLTTDMSSLEYQEVALGVARDYVAYAFRNTLQGLIKKTRIAAPLASSLKMRLEGLTTRLVDRDKAVADIKITSIAAGATSDAVTVKGTISHIYILNRLDVELQVTKPVPFTVSL